MSLESIFNIFLNFENILEECISNKDLENEVLIFEQDIIPTILTLINRYKMDFGKNIDITEENPKFAQIIISLTEEIDDLPFYLLGFIDYKKQLTL